MLSLESFSNTLKESDKIADSQSVISFYKANYSFFSKQQLVEDLSLIATIINALRRLGKLNASFKFIAQYGIQIKENFDTNFLLAYGWLLNAASKASYAKDIVGEKKITTDLPNDSFIKSEILHFCSAVCLKDEKLFVNLKSALLDLLCKHEKLKINPDWHYVIQFCSLINPSKLSSLTRTVNISKQGKITKHELASDQESWYSIYSKALFEREMFKECKHISESALFNLDKFHYNNDIWFERRIALSKKYLNDLDGALKDLYKILRKKKEWFIQLEIATILKEKLETEKALKMAIMSLVNNGKIEYKIESLGLVAEILSQKNENELANLHYWLSIEIRKKNEWKIPASLLEEFVNNGGDKLQALKYYDVLQKLKNYWNSILNNSSISENKAHEINSGKIIKILNDNERGIDGFIKSVKLGSIYFKLNDNDPNREKIKLGAEIIFKVLTKENAKPIAVKLRLADKKNTN